MERVDPVSESPIEGRLVGGCFPALLRSLYVGRRTGMLNVTRQSERGSVIFIGGHIVHGETSMPECRMGLTMVRHGLLGEEDLERVQSMVTPTKRLGQVLLELGIIDEERLQDALALHAREVLLSIFSWPEGQYRFEERDVEDFEGYDKALRLATGEVILDAVWSVTDPDVVRYALGDIDRPLSLTTDPLLRYQKITLGPTDGFILSRLDGALTAREILDMTPVGPEEAARSVLGMLCTGMIEYLAASEPKGEPAAKGLKLREKVLDVFRGLSGSSHFEVLGISLDATPDEVKAAYLRLSREFHPDAHHDPELADLRDKLDVIFKRLAEAHGVLSDLATRSKYETSLRAAKEKPVRKEPAPAPPSVVVERPTESATAPQSLDDAITSAETAIGEGRYWDAIAVLVGAMPGAKGRALTRARQLLARCYLRVPERSKEAEQELLAITRDDPADAEAHYYLGTIYRARGLAARAAGMFRKALQLKPRHTEAKAALEELEPSEPSKSGFFKKLLH